MKRNGAHSWQLAQVSRKRYILPIMGNIGNSFLTDMRIVVGRVLHTATESTLKRSYLVYFSFSFRQRYMVNNRWHYAAGITTLHMLHVSWCLSPCVHETELCVFLTINTFVSDKRCFLGIARTWKQFDHLESTLDFKSSVQKALNNSKTMLFDVHFSLSCCMGIRTRSVTWLGL